MKTLKVDRYLKLLCDLKRVREKRGLESPEEERVQKKLDSLWEKLSPTEVEELRVLWKNGSAMTSRVKEYVELYRRTDSIRAEHQGKESEVEQDLISTLDEMWFYNLSEDEKCEIDRVLDTIEPKVPK